MEAAMQSQRHTACYQWRKMMRLLSLEGEKVTIDGNDAREVTQASAQVNMHYPLVESELRNLPKKYVYAQAYRLLSLAALGHEVTSEKYARDISAHSNEMLRLLKRSPETPTGLVLRGWRPYPTHEGTTTAIILHAYARSGRLQVCAFSPACHAWLGWPYDVFMLAALGHYLALGLGLPVGMLHYTAGRLYIDERHMGTARVLLARESDEAESAWCSWPSAMTLVQDLRLTGGLQQDYERSR